jgi:hypothetical protein
MKERHCKQLLFWAPRALCILFAAFISAFALDVFAESYSIGETILALGIHLIPTAIILAILAISWRSEPAAGLALIAIAGWYAVLARAHWDWCLAISGPALLAGALFLVDWQYRSRSRGGQARAAR